MRVSELMQTTVVTAMPDTAISDIIVSLADAHVSSVPVVDGHRRILGVLSASDVLAAEAEASDPDARTVLTERSVASDLMTPKAITIDPDAPVREAARLMLYADVHRLYVVEHEQLVGVISTLDIVRAVATGGISAI
jgi:CBS domain-containing protein